MHILCQSALKRTTKTLQGALHILLHFVILVFEQGVILHYFITAFIFSSPSKNTTVIPYKTIA